jgi:myo-inositol-1(or 4)-monophosphatase
MIFGAASSGVHGIIPPEDACRKPCHGDSAFSPLPALFARQNHNRMEAVTHTRVSPPLVAIIATVKKIARQEIMPRYLRVAHERKTDGSLCTQADLAAQAALKRELPRILDYPVLGEEMADAEQQTLWQEGRGGIWCVDPIDGTSNFVNGIPYFAVSVAYMREGRPVLGVVYDPVANEVFYAERDRGAYLNGVALPIREVVPTLREAIAQVDFKRLSSKLRLALAQQPPYASQRNYGAATLEWCYVAAGRFNLYLHGGQKLWDYAAGSLILEEAGGIMSTLTLDDFWSDRPWPRSVVASLDHRLFSEWRQWVREHL